MNESEWSNLGERPRDAIAVTEVKDNGEGSDGDH